MNKELVRRQRIRVESLPESVYGFVAEEYLVINDKLSPREKFKVYTKFIRYISGGVRFCDP